MILVVGGNGNMGRRYCKILGAHAIDHKILDLNNLHHAKFLIEECSKMIIATPTELHEQYIEKALDRGIDVLCEKPISKNLNFVRSLRGKQVKMVNNYFYAYGKALARQLKTIGEFELQWHKLDGLREKRIEDTTYNYHYSGQDGIGWDCIQLIQYALGRVHFKNKSVVWSASINGVQLHLEDVLNGYTQMIIDFVTDTFPKQDWEKIIDAHQMAEWITNFNETAKSSVSNSGEA